MMNLSLDEDVQSRLASEAEQHGLAFLALFYRPYEGTEGRYLQTGKSQSGVRQVVDKAAARGWLELHWQGEYHETAALRFLTQMEKFAQTPFAEVLHSTVCQNLTAAHLHLELGLMNRPELEDFVTARELVSQANLAVRALMDELTGEQP